MHLGCACSMDAAHKSPTLPDSTDYPEANHLSRCPLHSHGLFSRADEKGPFLFTCVEFPYVLPVPQERSELRREAVELQAVLQPQLGDSLVAAAVWAGLAVLVQADELETNARHKLRREEEQGSFILTALAPESSSFPAPGTACGNTVTS